MDSSRRKTSSVFATLGQPFRARRTVAKPSRVACETLEGRQLLTGGASFAMPMSHPETGHSADVAAGSRPDGATPAGPFDSADAFAPFVSQTPLSMDGPGPGSKLPFGSKPDSAWTPGDASQTPPGFPAPGDGGAMMPRDATTQAPTSSSQESAALTDAQEKLRTDQQAIHDKSQVTPALQAAVRKDLEAIDAAKTGDADATAQATLQTDADVVHSAEVPTDAQLAKVQADVSAVFLSQGVSQNLIDQWTTDVQAVKTAANVSADDLSTLAADRAAIKALDTSATPVTTSAPPATATPVTATTLPATATAAVATPAADGSTQATDAALPVEVTPPATDAVPVSSLDVKAPTAQATPLVADVSASLRRHGGKGAFLGWPGGMVGRAHVRMNHIARGFARRSS